MDPISQGALGAAFATSAAGREKVVPALFLGSLSGMAADLDVLIRSSSDPLLFLEYHRHFTHAVAFAPIGALVCAAALHLLVRGRLRFRESYVFCLLGYVTHGVLDACTSYGTALLWPFSEVRVAWNFISVVDPLFTVPMASLLLFTAIRRQPRPARIALLWATAYLSFGVLQNLRAEQAGLALAANRGHVAAQLTVKPAFGNLLLWKTLYATDEWFHVDAVRLGLQVSHFPGERAQRLDLSRDVAWLAPGSQQAVDIERFRRFSDGYLSLADGDAMQVVDIRYSMVPNEIDALWGIRLDPAATADQHAEFVVNRRPTPEHRQALFDLLFAPGH